jgi:hypothetical protein
MAYVANQQRKTFNDNAAKGDFDITVATFQINKYNREGGESPYSLFKIQANWSSGSLVANSELYVNQTIYNDSGSLGIDFVPPGTSGAIYIYPISGSTNYSNYPHLLTSEGPEITNFFSISFQTYDSEILDPDYYLVDVIVHTPNYNDGILIADSYCYILNTL